MSMTLQGMVCPIGQAGSTVLNVSPATCASTDQDCKACAS